MNSTPAPTPESIVGATAAGRALLTAADAAAALSAIGAADAAATTTALAGKVAKAGDTMTGPLATTGVDIRTGTANESTYLGLYTNTGVSLASERAWWGKLTPNGILNWMRRDGGSYETKVVYGVSGNVGIGTTEGQEPSHKHTVWGSGLYTNELDVGYSGNGNASNLRVYGNLTATGTVTAAGGQFTNGLTVLGGTLDLQGNQLVLDSEAKLYWDAGGSQVVLNPGDSGTPVRFANNGSGSGLDLDGGTLMAGGATIGGTTTFGLIDTTVPGNSDRDTGYASNGTHIGKLVRWYSSVPAWQPVNT